MSKFDLKLQSNFIEIALRHGCSPVNLLHISRTSFYKNTHGGLLLYVDYKHFRKMQNRSMQIRNNFLLVLNSGSNNSITLFSQMLRSSRPQVSLKRCSYKFHKIDRKTHIAKVSFLIKLQAQNTSGASECCLFPYIYPLLIFISRNQKLASNQLHINTFEPVN